MFERFTEKAIKVVMLAQEEARRLGHNFVGTEQILLGLIGESTGIAAKVLKSMGVTLKEARTEVEKIIGRGSGFVAVEIPFTPRAKRVLEMSLEEARQLGELRYAVGTPGAGCRVPCLPDPGRRGAIGSGMQIWKKGAGDCWTEPPPAPPRPRDLLQATTTSALSTSCWVC